VNKSRKEKKPENSRMKRSGRKLEKQERKTT
jgi:hypothetical protein